MRFAQVSFACTLVVVAIFFGGNYGIYWPPLLVGLWFGLVGVATVSGLIGLGAAASLRQTERRRLPIVILSLPALLTAAAVVLLVIGLTHSS